MKLITELLESTVSLVTEETDKGKQFCIEGIFMQSEIRNKNNRLYPRSIMEKEVGRYVDSLVLNNRAYGELGHPPTPKINEDRISHLIKELSFEGNNVYGKAVIVNTPNGNIVKGIMECGGSLGVSSRALGTLNRENGIDVVQDTFKLSTAADIVIDPSAPDAFVKGIMEDVEWFYDERRGWIAEETKKEIRKLSLKQIQEQKVKLLGRYIRSL